MSKKILFISEASVYKDKNGFFHSKSGGASYVHNMAKSFSKKGFNVVVFSLKEFEEQNDEEIIDGVLYIRRFSINRGSFLMVKYLFFAFKMAFSYDIVFYNQFLPHLLLALLFFKQNFVIFHDVYLNNKVWFNLFSKKKAYFASFLEYLQIKFASVFSKKILVVSESTKFKIFKYLNNKSKTKVIVVSNTINLKKYKTLKKENFLLFVARFVNYKRPIDAICVFKFLQNHHPDLKFKMVVTRKFDNVYLQIKQKINELSIKNLELLENLPEHSLLDLYSKALVLIHPSVVEGQGIVVLEALASGTPVSAYDLPAYNGILISGKNSELAKMNDLNALKKASLKILNNYSIYQKNTLITLSKFDMKTFDKSINDIIDYF